MDFDRVAREVAPRKDGEVAFPRQRSVLSSLGAYSLLAIRDDSCKRQADFGFVLYIYFLSLGVGACIPGMWEGFKERILVLALLESMCED